MTNVRFVKALYGIEIAFNCVEVILKLWSDIRGPVWSLSLCLFVFCSDKMTGYSDSMTVERRFKIFITEFVHILHYN